MKKIITLLCLIACVCSFTACGSVEVEDAYQTEKTAFAEQNVVGNLMSLMEQVAADENLIALYEAGSYTAEEWE